MLLLLFLLDSIVVAFFFFVCFRPLIFRKERNQRYGRKLGQLPASIGAALPFFFLPAPPLPPAPAPAPAAALRLFLTPAPVRAPLLREAGVALAVGVAALLPLLVLGAVVDSAWAILRSFLRCSWTARGVQVVVAEVSWEGIIRGLVD